MERFLQPQKPSEHDAAVPSVGGFEGLRGASPLGRWCVWCGAWILSDITWLGTYALNSLPSFLPCLLPSFLASLRPWMKRGTRWALRRLWAMSLQEARNFTHTQFWLILTLTLWWTPERQAFHWTCIGLARTSWYNPLKPIYCKLLDEEYQF